MVFRELTFRWQGCNAYVSLPPATTMGEFMRKVQDRRINARYSLVCKLGEGGHGAVYLGMYCTTLMSNPLTT